MNRPGSFSVGRRMATAGAVLVACLSSGTARAQPRQAPSLRWDPLLDLTVTAVAATIWIGGEALKPNVAPQRCRWCAVDGVDARVRDALVWRDPGAADVLSNVTAFAVLPAALMGLDALGAARANVLARTGEDVVLIAQAGLVAAGLTEVVKMATARERPFAHWLPSDRRASQSPDDHLSFYSGHVAGAFALAVAAGTVGSMRGYRSAPVVWGVGGALAVTTAYLRIAADEHWLTDVLVGAVVGAGVGFALPFVFHPVEASTQGPPSGTVRAVRCPVLVLSW